MTDEDNILDSEVQQKIQFAASLFETAVCDRYTLPLVYHRQNTITFSGTGSGSGTLTVTINGTNYDIAITSGVTAAQVADLFRESAIDSADFIVALSSEKDEQGEIVTIISRTDSDTWSTANAEVSISSAGGTVQGITGTAGVRSDRYPQVVSYVVAELASSLLLMDNYGAEAEDTPKDGNARMEKANQLLALLAGEEVEGMAPRKIIDDVTKSELTTSDGNSPSFFPTLASKTDTDDPTESKIGINSNF